MIVMSGNSNRPLAEAICGILNLPLTRARVRQFPDTEVYVGLDESVRGQHVFIVQPLSAPVNDHLMSLLIMADSLKRSSAAEVTAVVPYLGYNRQDRKASSRGPIAGRLVADLLQTAGIDRLVTFDLHSTQIEGFFKIPTDNLFAAPLFARDIKHRFKGKPLVIVSPDMGGVSRARAVAKKMGLDLAIVDKRRQGPGETEVIQIIGDVKDKYCIVVDDIIDSASTLVETTTAMLKKGAIGVSAYATHGVFSRGAEKRIEASGLDTVMITDSIFYEDQQVSSPKVMTLSLAPLLAEIIERIANNASISNLFDAETEIV